MSRPFPSRFSSSSASYVRVNGKIRAREVRVIGVDGNQMGILSLADAINLARANGVDLVEIAPNATPPVCRVVDYGKYRYEQAKKDKEAKKHQHANKVKEVQLSPSIDPHDFGVKLGRAIDFLCEDMKVKVALKFRGREMAHKEFGFQVVEKFIVAVAPYGHPDAPPKLLGKGLTVMLSPLPRNKRAKNPRQFEDGAVPSANLHPPENYKIQLPGNSLPAKPAPSIASKAPPTAFGHNPFAKLDLNPKQEAKDDSAAAS